MGVERVKKNEYDGKDKNDINNKGRCVRMVFGGLCIYYVSNNGKLLGIYFMFSGKKNWKWENRSYQYYYTNDECKLIGSIKFN